MRAGTDPKQVAVLSAALEKVARSPDFVKYLEDELAFADSFIPAAQAAAFLERELKSDRAEHAEKISAGHDVARSNGARSDRCKAAAMKERLRLALPYAVMLLVAGLSVLREPRSSMRPSVWRTRIGPDFWPKVIIAFMARCASTRSASD